MTSIDLPSSLSGYETTDDYVAQRTVQGERVHYLVAIPLPRIPEILPVPDPKVPFADNRVVRESHAKGFADYVYGNTYWHSGPLTIRTTSETVSFDVANDLGTVQIGTLKVPRSRRGEFRIVDGQHRVLGVQKLLDKISAARLEQSNLLQRARDNGAEPAQIRQFEQALERIGVIEKRVQNASIVIDLVVENDDERARQIFVDVADNALGINKAVKDRFDMKKVVNRALNDILNSPPLVLDQRVDMQKNAISGSNVHWLGAGTVSDIIRILEVGIAGRVSAAQEKVLEEALLARRANEFFTGVTAVFPDLQLLAESSISAQQLRSTSLLGSQTMMKILAGVYHELTVVAHRSPSSVMKFFEALSRHMGTPITAGTRSGDLWLSAGKEGAFVEGAMAPGARAQQVKDLVATISAWIDKPPSGF